MSSPIDQYKANSASSLDEYSKTHKEYKTNVDTLRESSHQKGEIKSKLDKELEGIKKEDDPLGYASKETERDEASASYTESQASLKEGENKLTEYKKDNPTYAKTVDNKSEIDKIAGEIPVTREASKQTTEEIGSDLQNQGAQAKGDVTQSEVGKDNVNVTGNYNQELKNPDIKSARAAALADPTIKKGLSQVQAKGDDSLEGGGR